MLLLAFRSVSVQKYFILLPYFVSSIIWISNPSRSISGRSSGISVSAASVSAAVSAAAAGEQNDCQDDQPYPVIVKEIAKTVVHNRSSFKIRRGISDARQTPFCYQNMRKARKCARLLSKKTESRLDAALRGCFFGSGQLFKRANVAHAYGE